jgi:hypothetical protein
VTVALFFEKALKNILKNKYVEKYLGGFSNLKVLYLFIK